MADEWMIDFLKKRMLRKTLNKLFIKELWEYHIEEVENRFS